MIFPGTGVWRQAMGFWVLVGLWTQTAWGQGLAHWRVYRKEEGLVENFVLSVTASPRGQVATRHAALAAVSLLDGHEIRIIPGSEENRFPIWESRSGQVWSLHKAGLMEFKRDGWTLYPVESIREEYQANPLRASRPIPLLPAERDHVLLLLPRELLKVNPASNRIQPLRTAGSTGLGAFMDLIESRDGGVWITGIRGVARLSGSFRMMAPDSPWQEHLLDPAWGITGLSRPVEDDDGRLVVLGETAREGERVMVSFDGQEWSAPEPLPEGARAVWRGIGERRWAQAKSLLHESVAGGAWQIVELPGLPRAQVHDVAVESAGVFWVATSEGLARCAPLSWRQPPGVGSAAMDILGMVEHRGVGVWLVSPGGLYLLREGRWRAWGWPEGFRPSGPVPRNVRWLEGQRVLIAGESGGPLVFDLASERFHPAQHPQPRTISGVLGEYRPGAVFLETTDEDGVRRLEVFDGSRFSRWPEDREIAVELEKVQFVDASTDDRIWLGQTNGVTVWDPGLGRFGSLPGVPGGTVHAILSVAGGKLWLGGEGTIVEYDGRGWQVLRTGLGRVHSMRSARDGTVWVASEAGLWSYSDRAWLKYGPEEGFPAGEVWDVLVDQEGGVYAASSDGLFRYHREADLDEPASRFDPGTPRETPTTRELVVRYRGRDKWDYTPESRLVFSHRLDDGMWAPFDDAQEVVLTNLTAGQHRLAVRAMDRNRNEESNPSVWEFVAFVPWYAEPRILLVTGGGLLVAGVLAWLAVNRHLRLRRSYAEIEGIVEQRTSELREANRELLHSQKMRALGTLAAGIAHDFNSILSIIKGSAQIIEHHPDDPDRIKTRVSRIKTMVEQGSGIVQAMLGFSRGTAVEARACDLGQLVTETARLVGDQMGVRVTLECEVAEGPITARTVSALIRQILLNLLFNAVEASGGEGTIRLRVMPLALAPANLLLVPSPAERYVKIDVTDQGHGIPPEIQSRIFEPFFTTKAFSTRRGTGLGLSMVYEIAKELGLGLGVSSQPGRGSTFTLFVPVVLNMNFTAVEGGVE